MFVWAVLGLAAWGVLAFGAVYSWAYWPLIGGAAVVGGLGLLPVHGTRRHGPTIPMPVAAGILLALAAPLLQLVPLSQATLARWSPETDRTLRVYSVEYASGLLTSHPLSLRPESTWLAVALFAALALLLFGVARMMSLVGVRSFATGVVILGTSVAIVGIVQKPFYDGRIYGFWEPELGGSPFGPFVNRNHYAGWMIMALCLSLGYLCGRVAQDTRHLRRGLRERIVWFGSRDASQIVMLGSAVFVMALALVLTMSRSGIACCAGAVTLTAWFVARRERGARKAVLSAYLALVLLLAIGWAGAEAVASRFQQAADGYALKRAEPWLDALDIARAFMPFGSGLNTYGVATLFFQKRSLEVHYAEAHNDYLQVAAEGGLLLLVPAALAVVAIVRAVRRRFLEAGDDTMTAWVRIGAVTGLLAIALQEAVDFSLQMPGNAVLFTVVLAAALHQPVARAR